MTATVSIVAYPTAAITAVGSGTIGTRLSSIGETESGSALPAAGPTGGIGTAIVMGTGTGTRGTAGVVGAVATTATITSTPAEEIATLSDGNGTRDSTALVSGTKSGVTRSANRAGLTIGAVIAAAGRPTHLTSALAGEFAPRFFLLC